MASLRGQQIPFMNVFQPKLRLGYHVAGDVLAGTLQTLSGVRLHSSGALSLAHDLMFGLAAICISALVATRGPGRAWCVVSAIAPLAVFLSGPPNVSYQSTGHSFFNFYQMSYRPHVVLAGLLIVGISAALLRLLFSTGRRRSEARLALPAAHDRAARADGRAVGDHEFAAGWAGLAAGPLRSAAARLARRARCHGPRRARCLGAVAFARATAS